MRNSMPPKMHLRAGAACRRMRANARQPKASAAET